MKVPVENKFVGLGEPCLITLEPSATYENLETAKKMVDAIALSGADAVKFQTFVTGESEKMMGKKDITIDFTTNTGKKSELVYDALKRRELSKDEWIELFNYTKKHNLLFISSPYFVETVDFLYELGIDAFKISKGDINNVILIDKVAQTNLPVILDTREKLDDIETAITICKKHGNNKIIIMHCPSGYPAENSGVHLNAIHSLQEKYDYPIAFADHSPGGIMNYAAIGLGVSMLEKTITPNKNIEHVEHFMSLELDELKSFVANVREIEKAMGDPNALVTSRVEESARRSLTAKRDIKKGEKITLDMIEFRRPGDAGIPCSEGFKIIDKTCNSDIPSGDFIQWEMLS